VGSRCGRSLHEFAIPRKWCNGGADRAQFRRATVMESSFSRDHRWVAFGAWDASVKVLDLHNAGSSKPEQFSGHAGRTFSVAFSPDSRFLVTSVEDRTVRVWDPEDPRQAPVTLRVHEGPVWLVGFSSDSRLLVTRSADETLMLRHLGCPPMSARVTAGRQEGLRHNSRLQACRPCVDQPIRPATRSNNRPLPNCSEGTGCR